MTFSYLAEFMACHPTLSLFVAFQRSVWSVHLHDQAGVCLLHIEGMHIESTLETVLGVLRRAETN